MRLKSLLMCALAALGPVAHAEFTAESALLSMPAEVIAPALPQTVADLVEYARSGRFDHTEANRMGGRVQITALSPMRAQLLTGTGRTLTLNLLPAAGDTVIALTETLEIPQADSRLTVYSRSWAPLPKLWKEPKAADWLTEQGRKNRQAFADSVPFIVADYVFDPASGILTLTNRSESRKYMRSELHYSWTPKGFKKLKE